ncbi:ABC transporter substrate-binding protein [Microbacterium sp. SLBN-146]|uniref:ABC transporter substrate-binding protein n=1 Tax=Microbacterium sp. SLBN-146 TaxID=2768457 RepID=UPI001C92EFD4|nr:ABC transporter substrate-binding protein [Microbacterium sp. SLBN-146]
MKRTSTRRLSVAAIVATVVVLAACAPGDGNEDADGATVYSVVAPLVQSGPGAFAGIPVTQGIELAIAEVNASDFLGDGATIEMEFVDTAGDPAKAIAAYREAEASGAAGVLCCTLGGEAGALQPLLSESTLPGVVTVSILDGLADPPHLFRPFEVPSAPGGTYDEFLDAVFGAGAYSSAVMVVNNDNDAMVQDSSIYAEGLARNGVELRETVEVPVVETSYVGPATQIIALDPDVVVASTIGSSTANLAKALRERGFDRPIVSNVGADSRAAFDASAGAMAGTIFPTPFHADYPVNDRGAAFAAAYEDEYGTAPDMFAAQGYTAAWLLATAIRDAGTGDPAAVGEALSAIGEQESVYGRIIYVGGQAEVEETALHLVWGDAGDPQLLAP